MFAATVRCGKSSPSWNTRPTWRRSGVRPVTSAPAPPRPRPAHAGDGLQHQALAGAARAEQHQVPAVLHLEVHGPRAEAAGLHLESAHLDHFAPVPERRRGTRNERTSRNTTNATMTMSTAGGCAARSPNPSNRSNVSTEMTLGL